MYLPMFGGKGEAGGSRPAGQQPKLIQSQTKKEELNIYTYIYIYIERERSYT